MITFVLNETFSISKPYMTFASASFNAKKFYKISHRKIYSEKNTVEWSMNEFKTNLFTK